MQSKSGCNNCDIFIVTKYTQKCNYCLVLFVLNQCYKIDRGDKKKRRTIINENLLMEYKKGDI